MAAALITNLKRKEVSGQMGMEFLALTTVTTGDWYVSKFNTIYGAVCTGVGHAAYITSISGSTITITCTGGDVVNMIVWGV